MSTPSNAPAIDAVKVAREAVATDPYWTSPSHVEAVLNGDYDNFSAVKLALLGARAMAATLAAQAPGAVKVRELADIDWRKEMVDAFYKADPFGAPIRLAHVAQARIEEVLSALSATPPEDCNLIVSEEDANILIARGYAERWSVEESGEPDRLRPATPAPSQQPISSRELIKRCGGDPDAPFEVGAFPPEMREKSLEQQPAGEAGGLVEVERVECVDMSTGIEEPADPIWRIVINNYCADFETFGAADNFAKQINSQREADAARIAELEAERDEAVNWSHVVERHGVDGFDALAETWLAMEPIKRMNNAVTSVFAKWANDDLMKRFKAHITSAMHQSFVEGALVGVRAEMVNSKAAEARAAKADADVVRKDARIAELERQVYVPGLWRCARCNFSLLQANLNACDGSVTARDQPGDKCPNCDSPLWRVTERQAGNEMVDRAEEYLARATKAAAERDVREHIGAQLANIVSNTVKRYHAHEQATARQVLRDWDDRRSAALGRG
ncbi:hypothetical protein KHC28_00120 [Ancylobacter sonchi]|uniref:hypothetical protein n=1 Tax=Ancylobacter sonchi TaxID=1937790 RepID=UPI001BD4B3C3|nr:hypothetical protein [Ancylobacter sonchi]MBS7532070.1 hypothetical protein [Ancylobacter sonchi]